MNNSTITNAFNVACNAGFKAPEKLADLIASLETPMYKVTVVGKYQVGKSTLINNVFLGGNSLKLLEGEGLCTTAIPTEIVYGVSSKLEVYHWADEAKTSECIAQTIDNPTEQNLKELTVSGDRNALVQKISRVKLYANNNTLKQYTVLDTPGIDDPNADLILNTTYRLIPESDLALVVVEDKQLDSIVMELLRKRLFNDGVSHIMVLVSYNPEHRKSVEMRKNILETIKAQVKGISGADIPVEMYCYDESCDDILCSADEIASTIQSFLSKNALAGKQSRAVYQVHRFLENCSLELATRIKAATQTAQENEALNDELAQKRAQIRRQCNELTALIADDLETVKSNSQGIIRTNIDQVFKDFVAELRKLDDVSELKERLEGCENVLKPRLSEAICKSTQYIEKQIDKVLEAHNDKFQAAVMLWNSWKVDKLDVDGGFIAKIPSLAFMALDVVVLNLLLPGGWIIALGGKFLQSKLLSTFSFQHLAVKMILSNAQREFDETRDKYITDVNAQMSLNIDRTKEEINKKLKVQFEEQMAIVKENISNASAGDSAETAKLKQDESAIENALAALDAEKC